MTNQSEERFSEIFFKNLPVGLDNENISDEDFEKIKSNKYDNSLKQELIFAILKKYPLKDNYVFEKWKKCLPNGLNKFYSIEDSEYEILKKEFPNIDYSRWKEQ